MQGSKRAKAALGGAIALAVLAVAGTAGASSAPAPTGSSNYGPFSTDPFLAQANDVQAALMSAGQADPEFATVAIDHVNRSITVYRVGGGTTPAYSSVPTEGIPISFAAADLTTAASHNLLTLIGFAGTKLSNLGANVSAASTDYTRGVTVTLASDTPEAEAAVRGFVPAADQDFLTFTQGTVLRHLTDRNNDMSPFFGGDNITSTSAGGVSAQCTSGFGGKSNADYIIVAYHCVNPGDKRMFITGHQLIGSDVYDAQNYDVSLISSAELPSFWKYANGETPTVLPVAGTKAIGSGTSFCVSGIVVGRGCGGSFVNEQIFPVTGGLRGNYNVDEWCANGNLWGDGDSGGPIYAPNSGGTNAAAISMASAVGGGQSCGPDLTSHIFNAGPGINPTTH